MTRRKHRRRIITSADWGGYCDVIFADVPCDWARPSTVRITRTQRGYSFLALFRTPGGLRSRVTVRVSRDGEAFVADGVELRFKLGVVSP